MLWIAIMNLVFVCPLNFAQNQIVANRTQATGQALSFTRSRPALVKGFEAQIQAANDARFCLNAIPMFKNNARVNCRSVRAALLARIGRDVNLYEMSKKCALDSVDFDSFRNCQHRSIPKIVKAGP